MLNLKPNILERDGKKSFVILTYEEFLSIKEALEDADDLQCLKEARAEEWDAPKTSLASVREPLEISSKPQIDSSIYPKTHNQIVFIP